MGRKSYKTGRKDAEILLNALLLFVEELAESTACADLEKMAKANWQADTELWVTQTTLKGLAELTDRYGHSLDTEPIRNAIACLFDLKIMEDKREQISRTTKTNSDVWRFALKLPSIDTEENLQWLFEPEGEWDKRRQARKSKPGQVQKHTAPKSQGVDWSKICRTMLEKQKRLTTNELLSADEDMKFELKDIHVPLALVQRTKPDKRSGDEGNSPEQGSRLYEPTYEEKQRFKHEEFLAQVLQEGKGQSGGKRIALIGEPGAGKTTLLQSIAFWISKNNLGLPIWISLADLQQADGNLKEFNEYLLCDWLNKAIPKPRLTSAIETDFTNQFESRQVWLLLDGVDEVVEKCGSVLNKIKQQLQGWVAKARVVLTCRLNIWESNANALEDFETYRLLDFGYPEQVREFICRWFRKSDPDKGEQLSTELDKSERQRIQDLVKNPLRLALLCSTWHRWQEQGGLPDTKAKLYKGFVDYFYDWKHNKHPTSKQQRQTLNKALGELSKWAIDQPTSRFRLRLDQIPETLAQTLGDKDEEGSLLWLATTKLGWLNNVGFAVENPDEPVYAFFHPTFQEYFAALVIPYWKYFLNYFPHAPAQGTYRIFDPQWKEVILLWLGREEVLPDHKEEFLMALVNFDDGCCNLYRYQCLFLARAGLTESREFLEFDDFCLEDNPEQGNEEAIELNSSYSLTELIVAWSCGSFNEKQQKWQRSPIVIEQVAEAAILDMEHSLAVTALSKYYLNNLQISIGCNWRTQWRVTEILFKIAPENPNSLSILEHLMLNCPKFEILILAYRMLAEIELEFINENNKLHKKLNKLSDHVKQLVVAQVINLRNNFKDKGLDINSTYPINTDQITALAELIGNCTDLVTCQIASERLEQLNCREPKTYEALLQLCASDNESIRRGAASALGKIYTDCPEVVTAAVNTLINLICTSANESIYQNAAHSIRQILQNHQFDSTLSALKSCRQNLVVQDDAVRYEAFYSVLLYCAYNLPYPVFYQAWHQQETVEKTTTSDSQSLNQADLSQSLQSVIANDPQLSQTIHLICIDGSQLIEPDRPAAEIYDQMLDQNCRECAPVPETMPALKLYWNSLNRNSDKRPVLVFYASSTEPYSETFLTDLSKFKGAICVVTSPLTPLLRGEGSKMPSEESKSSSGSPSSLQGEGARGWGSLQFFAPNQAIAKRCCEAQIADVVQWIREKVGEK